MHSSPGSVGSAKSKIGLQRYGDQLIHGTSQSPLKQPRNYGHQDFASSPYKPVVDKTQILGRPIEIIKGKSTLLNFKE